MLITGLKEFEGGDFVNEYFARGHEDLQQFRDELVAQHDVVANPGSVSHTYYRNIPTGKNMGMIVSESGKGPGAYPVTVCTAWISIAELQDDLASRTPCDEEGVTYFSPMSERDKRINAQLRADREREEAIEDEAFAE